MTSDADLSPELARRFDENAAQVALLTSGAEIGDDICSAIGVIRPR